jgi:3'(2'),5'-bisphosphate nucleotidase
MNADDLDALCEIAEDAGREIMQVYAAGGGVWSKADSSPLTEADLRADKLIRARLEGRFPGVFILSEESVSEGAGASGALFLVDPLDGTKEFLKRSDEFTVNIAFVQEGAPVAGVVHAPALGETFFAAADVGAWKRVGAGAAAPIRTQGFDGQRPLRIIGSRSHGGEQLAQWLSRLNRPHDFVAAGSSLKFCRIAEGTADLYPRFGLTSQWDTAAAQAVLTIAGGLVTDFAGAPLVYGVQRPVLNPDFVACGGADLLRLFRDSL